MRALLVALAAAVIVPAAAAGLDPTALVLGQVDVPAGFRVNREETGLRSNELEAQAYPETRARFVRWRRLTGYQATYERSGKQFSTIEARADVFRGADGARRLLEWVDLELRKAGIKGVKRGATGLGDGGWVYWAPAPLDYTIVIWREGRVFSGLMGFALGKERTLALARIQQRRVTAALR